MAVFYFQVLAKQCIGFIEEQDGSALLCSVNHLTKVFLVFADVFTHYRRKIDAVKIEL